MGERGGGRLKGCQLPQGNSPCVTALGCPVPTTSSDSTDTPSVGSGQGWHCWQVPTAPWSCRGCHHPPHSEILGHDPGCSEPEGWACSWQELGAGVLLQRQGSHCFHTCSPLPGTTPSTHPPQQKLKISDRRGCGWLQSLRCRRGASSPCIQSGFVPGGVGASSSSPFLDIL